jgi:hypothetical protein
MGKARTSKQRRRELDTAGVIAARLTENALELAMRALQVLQAGERLSDQQFEEHQSVLTGALDSARRLRLALER